MKDPMTIEFKLTCDYPEQPKTVSTMEIVGEGLTWVELEEFFRQFLRGAGYCMPADAEEE